MQRVSVSLAACLMTMNMWHSTGARTTAAFLINEMGTGSRVQYCVQY